MRCHTRAAGASIIGAAVLCLSWVSSAGASTVTNPVNGTVVSPANGNTYTLPGAQPANDFIIGSGSAVTYKLMQALNQLFNNVPGCVITTSSFTYVAGKGSQNLNYSCLDTGSTAPSGVATGVTAEQVPTTVGNNEEYAYLDNPVNDVAISEPPIASSNGIEQLENGRNNGSASPGSGIGASLSTLDVTGVNFATSSRGPGSGDVQGLNFVAYAVDGVSWVHFTKTSAGSTPTPSAKVSNLTQSQLQGIWDGTIYNWGQLGGKNAPIIVFSAPSAAGTSTTWKNFLGYDPTATSLGVNCASLQNVTPTGKGASATYPSSTGATGCTGPNLIFENELTSVPSADYADMIFYYSTGEYNIQCEGIKAKVEAGIDKSVIAQETENTKVGTGCGGSPTVGNAGKVALGEINGETATPSNVLGGKFAPVRDLYNVYSNGSNTNVPAATPATLNYVSEIGFLCKPQTIDGGAEAGASSAGVPTSSAILDPATGQWYETEIDDTILAQGYLPIDATAADGYDTINLPTTAAAEGSVPHTAVALLNSEAATGGSIYLDAGSPSGPGVNPTIPTAANPPGFCAVSTSDGNADQ